MARYENILLKNFIFLALAQGINQLLPLLVTPIILSQIGKVSFGQYAMYQYIIIYVALFINFGFLLSATKNVAILDLKEDITILFNSILYSKIFNFLGIIAFILIGIYFYPTTGHFYLSYSIGAVLTGIGYIFYQDWLFQGKQKIVYQFLSIVSSKIIYLLLLYVGIKWLKVDLTYLIFIDSFSILLMGIISHFVILYLMNIRVHIPILNNIKRSWKEGGSAFIAGMLISFFTSINVLLLGFYCNPEEVATYAVADRIFILISGLFAIILRVLIPNLAKTINKSEIEFLNILNKSLKITFVITIFISLLISIFGHFLLKYLLVGAVSTDSVLSVLRILLIAFIFQTVASLYSYYFVLKLRYKEMNLLLIAVAVINIFSSLILIPKYGAFGTALSTAFAFFCYYSFSSLIVHGFIKINFQS